MTHHRPYDDAKGDFQRIWNFLVEDALDRSLHAPWSIGRFADWKYNLVTDRKWVPTFLSRSAELWLGPFDEVLGVAINEDLSPMLTILTRTTHTHLYGEMLAWATRTWLSYAQPWNPEERKRSQDPAAPIGRLGLNLDALRTQEAAALTAQGWEDRGPAEMMRWYSVAEQAGRPLILEEDFRIVSMEEDPNFASKQRLYQNAWHDDEPVTDLLLRIYEYCRSSPIYDPSLDFSVVDACGEHIAGCTAYVDFANSNAEIEKVCTHTAYRRRGLAEALILRCFQELHRLGIRTVNITGEIGAPSSLYGKLGAIDERPIHFWQRVVSRG